MLKIVDGVLVCKFGLFWIILLRIFRSWLIGELGIVWVVGEVDCVGVCGSGWGVVDVGFLMFKYFFGSGIGFFIGFDWDCEMGLFGNFCEWVGVILIMLIFWFWLIVLFFFFIWRILFLEFFSWGGGGIGMGSFLVVFLICFLSFWFVLVFKF